MTEELRKERQDKCQKHTRVGLQGALAPGAVPGGAGITALGCFSSLELAHALLCLDFPTSFQKSSHL